MTNQDQTIQENPFREVQLGLQRIIGIYVEQGRAYLEYRRDGSLREEGHNCSLNERINYPYTEELAIRENQERTLRELREVLDGPVGRDDSGRRRVEQMINDLTVQMIPEDEARQQSSVNYNCRGYTQRFESCLSDAIAVVAGPHSSQDILPEETRQFNSNSAIQALRRFAERPIEIDNLEESFEQELNRINNTYLYSVYDIYRSFARRNGITIRFPSHRGFQC